MRTQLQVLGWVHIALRGLYVIGGVLILMLFSALGAGTAAVAGREAMPVAAIIGGFGWLIGGYLLILGLPGVLIGWGLLQQAKWARFGGIVISLFDLPFFPIGTLVGVHGLFVLFHPETVALFEGRPAQILAGTDPANFV